MTQNAVAEEVQESFLEMETVGPVVEVMTGTAITTTVPQFLTIAEQLNTLRAAYQNIEPDMSTVESRAATKDNWRKFRNVRLALDKAKPAAKEDLKKQLDAIEGDYKSIRAVLVEFETKFGDAIDVYESARKAEKEAEQKAEDERRDAILDHVNRIAAIPATAVGLNSADLTDLIEKVVAMPILAPEFQEFLSKAESVRDDALRQLREMLGKVIDQEAVADRLRAQMEEMKRQQANERRIDSIKRKIASFENYKNLAASWSIENISKAIAELSGHVITDQEYHEFAAEARDVLTVTIAEMHGILSDKKEAARIAEEQAAELKRAQAEVLRLAKEKADKEAADLAERTAFEAEQAEASLREAEVQLLEEERRAALQKEADDRAAEEARIAAEKAAEEKEESDRVARENLDAEAAALRAEFEERITDINYAMGYIYELAGTPGLDPWKTIEQIREISGKFIAHEEPPAGKGKKK